MSEFSVVLRIDKVGDKEALAALDGLDRAGRKIVENVSGYTGRAMGDVAVAFTRAGNAGTDAFRKLSAQIEIANVEAQRAVAVTHKMADAQERGSFFANAHGLQLGRLRMELGTLVGRLTGTNTALDRMAGALGGMAIGDPVVIGALAGVAAIAAGYDFLTKNAKAAEQALADVRKKAAEAANSGKADDLSAMARELQLGSPFSADGKHLMAASERVKGAFSGSIADLQAQRMELDRSIADAPNLLVASRLAQQEKKLDAVLNPLLEKLKAVRLAIANLASQPADNAGQLPGMSVTALSDDAIAKAADKAGKAAERAAKAYAAALHKLNKANAKVDGEFEAEAGQRHNEQLSRKADEIQTSLGSMQGSLKFNFDVASYVDPTQRKFDDSVKSLAAHMHEVLGRTLGEGLAGGFEAAFSGKGIGEAFKTLTATVLSGLGNFLESLGAGMLVTGTWLTAFSAAMHSLNGPGAIAAGVGLIAAGAALKAVAGSFGSGASSTGASYGGSSSSLAQIIDRGTIVPGSYSRVDAKTIEPRQAITNHFTLIGADDPRVTRDIDNIMRKIMQRGSLSGMQFAR